MTTLTPLQREIESYAIGSFFAGGLREIKKSATPMDDLLALTDEEWEGLTEWGPFSEYTRKDLEVGIEIMYESVCDLFDRVVKSGILREPHVPAWIPS